MRLYAVCRGFGTRLLCSMLAYYEAICSMQGLWDEVIMQYASLLRGYMQYAGALGRGYYAVC